MHVAMRVALVMLTACGGDAAEGDVAAETVAEVDAVAGDTEVAPGPCFALKDGSCVPETFKNPPVLQPNDRGVYELELKPTAFEVNGQRHCGRAYNGLYPAPTIEVAARVGSEARQVRVDLRNGFTRSDWKELGGRECTCTNPTSGQSCEPASGHGGHGTCECLDGEGELCHMADFNVTNLHAHGSHVRPDYAAGGGCVEANGLRCRSCSGDRDATPRECFHADDVISRVGPGEGVRHRWDIDEDGTHHEGLNWYHPHIHGTTAIQVASGATGALIVRGPLDEVPGIKEARERVLVVTTPSIGFTPLAEGEPCDEEHITVNTFSVLGATSEKQVNVVNGVRRPRMIMAPARSSGGAFCMARSSTRSSSGCSAGSTPSARTSTSMPVRSRSRRSRVMAS